MKYIEDIYKEWNGKSIAVVGNGTPTKNYGQEIDKHDIVIRFNQAWTKGYEDVVGSKTTVCTIGGIGLWEYFKEVDYGSFPYLFSIYHKEQRMLKINLPFKTYFPKIYYQDILKEIKCRKLTIGCRQLYHLYKNGLKADVYCFTFYETPVYFDDRAKEMFDFFIGHPCSGVDLVHNPQGEKKFLYGLNWFNFIL